MICPIMTAGRIGSSADQIQFEQGEKSGPPRITVKCIGKNCAFYDEASSQCAIKLLANCAADVVLAMT